MDQDFYFEESNPKWVTIIIVILVIAGLGAGYYFYKEYYKLLHYVLLQVVQVHYHFVLIISYYLPTFTI